MSIIALQVVSVMQDFGLRSSQLKNEDWADILKDAVIFS